MNSIPIFYKMETTFKNSNESKTSDSHRLIWDLSDTIN